MKPSAVNLLNAGAALLALAVSVMTAAISGQPPRAPSVPMAAAVVPATVTDAGGAVVSVRPFRRIAAASLVADRLLIDLAEPDRIVALTAVGARQSRVGHLYAGRALIADLDDIEALLGLKPDLLLASSLGDPARIARLRAAGITVFDLGEMRGLATLLPNIRAVAALLGDPPRGDAYAHALTQRLQHVAAPLGQKPRLHAMYVAIYGDRLFGGAARTSYHDVLTAAGLVDVAAAHFENWPAYGAEDLLGLNPALLVTKTGMRRALCAHPGLDVLRACREGGGGSIIELPAPLLDDPGPAMLDAAEALFQAAYEVDAASHPR